MSGEQYAIFLGDLYSVLSTHSEKVGITQADVAENLQRSLGDPSWDARKVHYNLGKIKKGRTTLNPDQLKAFIWAHEMAPYEAVRQIQRQNGSQEEPFLRLAPDRFQTKDSYITDGIVKYLSDFLSSPNVDIFLVELEKRHNTGTHHRRRDRFEVAWCISGMVEMEFHKAEGKTQKVKIKQGEGVAYDASIPHKTTECEDKKSQVLVISILVPTKKTSRRV